MVLTNMTNYLKNLALVGANGLRYSSSSGSVGEEITGLHPIKDATGVENTSVLPATYSNYGFFCTFFWFI